MDHLADPLPSCVARIRGPACRQRGQVLPIFAVMAVVLLGGAALLTDVAWWWVNEQRMQRAADAGALAGAIYLPGNEVLAFGRARGEAAKNGYVNGVDGVVVTPERDPGDPRKLIVDIDGPVKTNFAKVFCGTAGPASRASTSASPARPASCCRCPWAAPRTTTAWASCVTSSRRRPQPRAHRLEQPRPLRQRRPVVHPWRAYGAATPARPPTATSRTGGTSTSSVRSARAPRSLDSSCALPQRGTV